MATAPKLDMNRRRDWRTAFRSMRKLMGDPNATVEVFKIMQALNAGSAERSYERLLRTPEGGRMAYQRVELIDKLSDPAWVAQFAPGTVGATYRAFLERTGYSAKGLQQVGEEAHGQDSSAIPHPWAWMGRRERDIHDIWHVLTGYQADDPLGELCLVAFSYAQTGGLGWGFIALMGVLKNLREPQGRLVARAAWEGYRHGQDAVWLHSQDYERLFAEDIEAARKRLRIAKPEAYLKAKAFGVAGHPNAQLVAAE